MTLFERNQTSLIDKKIDDKVRLPKVGVVKQVFEHSATDDDSNWEINVEFDGGVSDEKRVPFHSHASGAIVPPKNGDKVLVIYTAGKSSSPIALSTGWSNKDRPPVGPAGIYRNEFESGVSPAGDGNLYINGYTKYDDDVASFDKRDLTPEETFIQIAKHADDENIQPSQSESLPAKIEMYDSPSTDEAWISVELNKVNGSDSDATWGIKFNMTTGELKLVDASGYGFTSDGNGNWTWEYDSKTETQVSGGGSLSL